MRGAPFWAVDYKEPADSQVIAISRGGSGARGVEGLEGCRVRQRRQPRTGRAGVEIGLLPDATCELAAQVGGSFRTYGRYTGLSHPPRASCVPFREAGADKWWGADSPLSFIAE